MDLTLIEPFIPLLWIIFKILIVAVPLMRPVVALIDRPSGKLPDAME